MAPHEIVAQVPNEHGLVEPLDAGDSRLWDEVFVRRFLGPNLHQLTASLARQLQQNNHLPIVLPGLLYRPWWGLLALDRGARQSTLQRVMMPIKLDDWDNAGRVLSIRADAGYDDRYNEEPVTELRAAPGDDRLFTTIGPRMCVYLFFRA